MGRGKHPLGKLHKCRMQEHINDDAMEKEVEEEVNVKQVVEEMDKGKEVVGRLHKSVSHKNTPMTI